MDTNAPVSLATASPGTPVGGGFLSHRFFIATIAYALIVSPKAEGDFDPMPWNKSRDMVAGACSYNDGLANTRAMAAAGSELGQRCLDLRIGGCDDWYLMSPQEAMLAHHELKAVDAFKEGGIEAFGRDDWYWLSLQHATGPDYAFSAGFVDGHQDCTPKAIEYRARAVRRLVIQ